MVLLRCVSKTLFAATLTMALVSGSYVVIETAKNEERDLKMSMKSYKKYGKGYQYAQMYHYPQPHYPPYGEPKYQPQYPPKNPPYYGEPKYQPQYPPKNPPYYGVPKYQPQYPPKNPPPPGYYYSPPKYKGKGKGKGAEVFGKGKHMKIRKMAKGGYGNFFPRIPGPAPDYGGGPDEIPFGIWPRIPRPPEEPMTPPPVPVPLTPPPVPVPLTPPPVPAPLTPPPVPAPLTPPPVPAPLTPPPVPAPPVTVAPVPPIPVTAAPVPATTLAPVTSVPTAAICSADDIGVSAFSLVDIASNTHLRAVTPGEELDLDVLEADFGTRQFTIVCNTTGPVESASLESELDTGDLSSALADFYNGFPFPMPHNQLSTGAWTVRCEPFCQDDLQGASGGTAEIDFTVTELDCTTCKAACISIVDFVLVDANKDLNPADPTADYLFSIEEGQEYSLAALREQYQTNDFALLCITDPAPFSTTPFEVGSVGLRDNNYGTHRGTAGNNNGKDYNSEGSAPYTLADDNSGDYNPTDFTLGEDWSIDCQAFCLGGLQGEESPIVQRNFRMVA